jgi:hypothetical protein
MKPISPSEIRDDGGEYYNNMWPDFAKMTDEQLEMIAGLTEGRILKIDKDALRMSEEQLFWSDELEDRVKSYWTKLNEYWDNKAWPPCTCKDREGGFMANEKFNPYFYGGEPCSLAYYARCVKEQLITDWRHNVKAT